MPNDRSQTTASKRVRILVAIDDLGHWVCHGSGNETDADCREWICLDAIESPYVFRWIEADIPLPIEVTIPGDVQNV